MDVAAWLPPTISHGKNLSTCVTRISAAIIMDLALAASNCLAKKNN
jgi:hypothetical protein